MNPFKKKIRLSWLSAIISLFTLAAFHIPFLKHVAGHVESGFNGVVIFASLFLLLLVLNYFATYLVLWLGRVVGKVIVGISLILDSVGIYFITVWDALLDDTMMGNVFNTNTAEATSFWTPNALLYILLLGVLPCVLVIITKIEYGSAKRFFANIGAALGATVIIAFGNMTNWPWIDREAPVIGSLLLPWSYTVNTVRYHNHERERNREEILLPDASIAEDAKGRKDVVVLVIGESARRDHFSLYGYERETTPLLQKVDGLKHYDAEASATYTTAGVKAILDHKETGKLYEILPNYLYRNGVDVTWRTSNWGEPPLHIEKHQDDYYLSEQSGIPLEYDEHLLYKIKEQILESGNDKVLIVLHTSTSHGPTYYKKYPEKFEKYTPAAKSVEMSKCPREEIINAYDNSILYTDYILASLIGELKALEGWNCCMLYVSDHGESLGENNLYMHGVPAAVAPAEQLEIPFIVWTSDGAMKCKAEGELTQYHVFHSILHFLGMESPIYNPDFDIFR